MNKLIVRPLSNIARLAIMATLTMALVLGPGQVAQAVAFRSPVDLGAAAPFVILTKTGVTNVPTSAITGNIGASPIAATAITGFSLIADSTNTFSTSSQVTGKVYAADYTSPTPANLTTAVSNMQTAYVDAAGRSIPDFTELGAGNISGKTLVPGLYKWGTGVLLTTHVTLAGPADAVWIFQIAGNLTLGSGAKVLLSGGALARNIFWQVAGGVGVEIGTTAHMEGNILAKKAIHLRTGASLNGRALAQTAVTLAQNIIVIPPASSKTLAVTAGVDGWVLESSRSSSVGGTMNSTATSLRVGDAATNGQYRTILSFDTSGLPANAAIVSVILKLDAIGPVGTNPFGTHGALLVDIRKPFFGTSTGLEIADFQAAASAPAVARFSAVPAGGWYSAVLGEMGKSFINRTGTTQFRLRFALADNNNSRADYMSFNSGNAVLAAARPRLVVLYYLP